MWTSKLEKKLNWHILKCPVTGSGTKEQYIKTKRVISQVGHNPKAIIVVYHSATDFNDDFFFPSASAFEGYRVERLKRFNLDTGEIIRNSDEDVEKRFGEYFRKKASRSKLYKLIRTDSIIKKLYDRNLAKKMSKLKQKIKGAFFSMQNTSAGGNDPVNRENYITDRYAKVLINSKYAEKQWFIDGLKSHKQNLRDFHNLARSIGAKLIIIDEDSGLQRGVMQDILHEFTEDNSVHYYNFFKEYKPIFEQDKMRYHYRYDGHWNKAGNDLVANLVYKHFKSAELDKL